MRAPEPTLTFLLGTDSWSGLGEGYLHDLTRLLREGSLESLHLVREDVIPLSGGMDADFGESAVAVEGFCSALRASKLTELVLAGVYLFREQEAGLAVVRACTNHPTLESVSFKANRVGADAATRTAFGQAMAALIGGGSETPLKSLSLRNCEMGDGAAEPLFAAVATTTQLLSLNISGCNISAICMRDVGLPALKANASLRSLHLCDNPPHTFDEETAAFIVAAGGDPTDHSVAPSEHHLAAEELIAERVGAAV